MSSARAGRGAGNGNNENWHNSPLWAFRQNKQDARRVEEFKLREALEKGDDAKAVEIGKRIGRIEAARTLEELEAAINGTGT